MLQTFRSLAVANYRIWYGGAILSNVGTWMQRIAQDWLVLTQLTDDDAGAVGIVMALQFGPQLLLLPLTGWIVDRVPRRSLLLITQSVAAALAFGLAALTLSGTVQLWMVYCFAAALGATNAFDSPARQTFVNDLVPPEYLSNAVALNATTFNVSRLVGPAIAGGLIVIVGTGWVFLINAFSFIGVLAALFALRPSRLLTPARVPTGDRVLLSAGFRYAWKRKDILLVLVIVALAGTFCYNFPIFISAMTKIEFGLDASAFGILSSVIAIGSLTGSLASAQRKRARLRTVVLACAGLGFSLAACALAPNPYVFGVTIALVGFSALTCMTTANAYVQTTTPPEVRGRVIAIYLAIFTGGTPLGAPLTGWIADTFGPRWSLSVGAAGGVLAAGIGAVYYLRTRHVRLVWDRERRFPVAIRRDSVYVAETAASILAMAESETPR